MQKTGQQYCLINVKDISAMVSFNFCKHWGNVLGASASLNNLMNEFLWIVVEKPDHIFELERRQQVLEV
jgi:hypothetical protein